MITFPTFLFINILQYPETTSANHWETFLSNIGNIGTFILSLAAGATFIWGTSTFKRWQKENRLKKRSDFAEDILNKIDISEQEIHKWLGYVSFVYSRRSDANQNNYENMSPEKQKELLKFFDSDEFELANYVKKGNAFIEKIILARNRASVFKNEELLNSFDKLVKEINNFTNNLNRFHFPNATDKMKAEASEVLFSHPNSEKVRNLCKSIRDDLIKYMMFDE